MEEFQVTYEGGVRVRVRVSTKILATTTSFDLAKGSSSGGI
jgi:hypothetical protein